MIARADLDLHPPIPLSERGPGAADSVIWSGVASAADVLHYADGDDEITVEARRDTAEQLRGVPVVSAEDHQRWLRAQERGEPYELTPLGTVLDSAMDDEGRAVFSMSVHGAANADIRSRKTPAVSVGYVARYGTSSRADRAQRRRIVNHLALVPRGRDPHARIRADGEDPMPTLAEMDLNALIAALVPELVKALMAATKTEMEPLIDGCLAKRLGDAAPLKVAEGMIDAGDMAAMMAEKDAAKADAAAQKARADAAEARLLEIDRVQARADAAAVGVTLAETDLADAAALGKAREKIAAAAIQRARADSGSNWKPPAPPAGTPSPSVPF